MMDERLPAAVEVTALVRRAQSQGDFAAVLKSGDPDRGSVLLVVSSRGRHIACLERMLSGDGTYRWTQTGPRESAGSTEITDFLARRTRFDEDSWTIELDIAEPERFIAETIRSG